MARRAGLARRKCRLPVCSAPTRKQISSPAIQFKGTGWYLTDYARKGKAGGSDSGSKEGGGSTDAAPASAAGSPAPGGSQAGKSSGGDAPTGKGKTGAGSTGSATD